jgi:hypothetical protein
MMYISPGGRVNVSMTRRPLLSFVILTFGIAWAALRCGNNTLMIIRLPPVQRTVGQIPFASSLGAPTAIREFLRRAPGHIAVSVEHVDSRRAILRDEQVEAHPALRIRRA